MYPMNGMGFLHIYRQMVQSDFPVPHRQPENGRGGPPIGEAPKPYPFDFQAMDTKHRKDGSCRGPAHCAASRTSLRVEWIVPFCNLRETVHGFEIERI